jgi:hypothetical protein
MLRRSRRPAGDAECLTSRVGEAPAIDRFRAVDSGYVQAGYRHRRIYDPTQRADTFVTEPVREGMFRHLEDWTLWVTFRDGRVSEVQRAPI